MNARESRTSWKSRALWASAAGTAVIAAAAAPARADGVVTVSIRGDTATIEGDDAANLIILNPSGATVNVIPTAGTSVTGQTSFDTNVVKNLVIRLGDGNDYVEGILSLSGNLVVDTGDGNDTVVMQNCSVDNLALLAGDGNDSFAFSNSVVNGNAAFVSAAGQDTCVLRGTNISGNLRADFRQGTDEGLLILNSANITGKTTVNGNPSGTTTGSVAIYGNQTTFSGRLKIRGGAVGDIVDLLDAFLPEGLDVKGGAGNDTIAVSECDVRKNSKVSGDDGDDAITWEGTRNKGGFTPFKLVMNGGDGNDDLFLGSSAGVTNLGSLVVNAGDGDDASVYDEVNATSIVHKDGAGNDTVRLQSNTAESLKLDGGSGTDSTLGRFDGGNNFSKQSLRNYESELFIGT